MNLYRFKTFSKNLSIDKEFLLPTAVIVLALSIFIGNDNGKYQAVGEDNSFVVIDTSTGELYFYCKSYNDSYSDRQILEDNISRRQLNLPDTGRRIPSNQPSRYYSIWTYKESDADYHNYRCYSFDLQ
ncbi:hypothetical protein L0U88_12150 [Flavihumibacter sp. RY-1]|uniref:Uncharacterized protein n=2 Tax=Flavihumibacter fluminis TaxID=2909236 RepID=A0ABS9BI37_9BACT|nr:hypothetical protein [Flavihumibacter fluminis]